LRRRRQAPEETVAALASATLGAQLVAGWTSLPEFLAHNITHAGPPMLERSVYYDSLSDDDAAELETVSREIGMQASGALPSPQHKTKNYLPSTWRISGNSLSTQSLPSRIASLAR
jgi:hypothetical protein